MIAEAGNHGYLSATVHHVASPPAHQQRLYIAFFLSAQLDATVPIYTFPEPLAQDAHGPQSDP